MMSLIVSSIPGRMRVRHPALVASGKLARLQAAVLDFYAGCQIEANPRIGSLLLVYDAQAVAREAMEAAVLRFASAGGLEEIPAPQEAGQEKQEFWRGGVRSPSGQGKQYAPAQARMLVLNRYAKYGMLASLGATLYLAAAGKRRWHALSGAAFVGALGVHLATHRQRILS
ncbi:MAG: hypothetical protein LBS89_06720 [Zoogloeaceae bacterium]|jgi:hypothetical protein|nr:hypothetical protein [Zoogloeaceae bacterium]